MSWEKKKPNHSSAMPTSFVDDFSPFSAARLRHFLPPAISYLFGTLHIPGLIEF